jgi:hypothetical protein
LKAMPFQNMGRSLSTNGSPLAAVRASKGETATRY